MTTSEPAVEHPAGTAKPLHTLRPHAVDIDRLVKIARRLGVELDPAAARKWLAATAAMDLDHELVVDTLGDVYGCQVVMLDFSPAELARVREVGAMVQLNDLNPQVECAVALAGSAAQSMIQAYPGDCDYYERINVKAADRDEACERFAKLLRDKVLEDVHGPSHELLGVKFGSYPHDVIRGERLREAGWPIAWSPSEVRAGYIEASLANGEPCAIRWADVNQTPGFCKLDWVVTDSAHQQLVSVSNVLDVTWEAPDGTILPLTGYIDPDFQEVYLASHSLPLVAKLLRHVDVDATSKYVAMLEGEIRKYLGADHLNYAKVAKRLYNIYRLTGRVEEAVYLRSVFNGPPAVLYRVWSLLETIEQATTARLNAPVEVVRAEMHDLIGAAVSTLPRHQQASVTTHLRRLAEALASNAAVGDLTAEADAARDGLLRVINTAFHARLVALPSIRAYLRRFDHPIPRAEESGVRGVAS